MDSTQFFYTPEPDGEMLVTKWFKTAGVYLIECNTIQDTSFMGGRSSWRMGYKLC